MLCRWLSPKLVETMFEDVQLRVDGKARKSITKSEGHRCSGPQDLNLTKSSCFQTYGVTEGPAWSCKNTKTARNSISVIKQLKSPWGPLVYRPFALLLWDWVCRKTGHKSRQKKRARVFNISLCLHVLLPKHCKNNQETSSQIKGFKFITCSSPFKKC